MALNVSSDVTRVCSYGGIDIVYVHGILGF